MSIWCSPDIHLICSFILLTFTFSSDSICSCDVHPVHRMFICHLSDRFMYSCDIYLFIWIFICSCDVYLIINFSFVVHLLIWRFLFYMKCWSVHLLLICLSAICLLGELQNKLDGLLCCLSVIHLSFFWCLFIINYFPLRIIRCKSIHLTFIYPSALHLLICLSDVCHFICWSSVHLMFIWSSVERIFLCLFDVHLMDVLISIIVNL